MLFSFTFFFLTYANAQRMMENLGRGLVAFRTSETEVFLSWRMLGADAADISFNLYRDTTLLASTTSTNFVDQTEANKNYCVKPVIDGVELEDSSCTGVTIQPYIGIPLQPLEGYFVHFVWVGDLDGDGEYDFIVDRHGAESSKLEAYRRDGTFLWRYDCGPNGLNKDNIAPGSSAISIGHADDVTVYDLDSDGQAEVIVKTANGVIFGDGSTLEHDSDNEQFISVLNGMTGAEEARAPVPTDYIADGPVQGHFGIMYCDGVNPSFVFKAKNRRPDGGFNLMAVTYDYKDGQLTQRWKWNRDQNAPDAHQIRIVDIDGDGRDELCDGGYVIDDDGSFLYAIPGTVHGDRFQITDFDPDRPGLEGYYIQQNNSSGLAWVYYDAKNGDIIKQQFLDAPADLARGTAADLDPRYRGVEFWTFTDGIYTPQSETPVSSNFPWPNFKIWWDGDLSAELLNAERISKWLPEAEIESRLLTASDYGAVDSWRDAAQFHGDIIGDWREEVIFANTDQSEIMIFSTTHPTTERLYTLPHNPGYRACMTVKGYQQSNLVDYYLGNEMDTPPVPDIVRLPKNPVDDEDTPLWRPQHLIATAHNDTVTLTWGVNPDSRVAGYNLYRSDSSGGPYEKLNASPILTDSYIDTILVLETTYYYVLASVDAEANESNPSAEVSAMPTLRSAPPTGLAVVAVPDTVILTWQRHEDPNVVGYTIYRSETSGQSYVKLNEELVADTSYIDTEIVNETTYFYVVTAVNALELESEYSVEANGTPGYSIFLQAEDAELGGGSSHDTNHNNFFGTGFVNLPASGGYVEFQNIDGGEGDTIFLKYRYALGNDPRTGRLQINDKQGDITMESTGDWSNWQTDEVAVVLNAGTDNVIRFETTGQDFGNLDQIVIAPAPPGTEPDFPEPEPLGVQALGNDAVHIYPNPTENRIIVESRHPGMRIELLGLDGQALSRQEVHGGVAVIELESLASGLYIIHLITDEGHFREKIVVR